MIGIIKVVLLLSILFLNMQILNARGNASKIMTVYDFILNKELYKDTKVMTLGYLRKINYMNEDTYYLFPTKDNAIISNTAAAIKLSFPNSREFKLISSCDENFVRIIGGVIANKSNTKEFLLSNIVKVEIYLKGWFYYGADEVKYCINN